MCLFKQRKMNKQNKSVVKIIKKSLIYLLGDNIISFSPCLFLTHHAIYSSLEGNIRKVWKYRPLETSLSWFSSYIDLYASLD